MVPRGGADRPGRPRAALLDRAAKGSGRVPSGDAGGEDEDQVEDAPFVAIQVDEWRDDAGRTVLRFTTNVGDVTDAGPDNPIRVEIEPRTGEPRPYVHVRRGLEALISRPVFYELAELASERDVAGEPTLGVESGGAWFPISGPGADLS